MNGDQFIEGCDEPEDLGLAWGERLWRFNNPALETSIDVHAETVEEARAAAAAAWEEMQARADAAK